jgi:hypothetical protein
MRAAAAALAAVALGAPAPPDPVAIPDATLYPRLIAVHHNARLRGRLVLATLAGLRQSRDGGRSWMPLAAVPQLTDTTERCCGVIYELPQRVGQLAAGSFLYAATYRVGARTAIRVYRSDDGVAWQPHGTLAAGGPQGSGVWEPQFAMTRDGALAVFWSDETDPCCSQRLRRARTRDGIGWIDAGDVVRSRDPADRPGMATTAQLPDGRTAMTYEICGPHRCAVYIRYSRDGWEFGDPHDAGRRVETAAGEHLEHAPTVVWAHGGLLVVGQMVVGADGVVSPRNGRVVLRGDGGGPWRTISSPIQVPGAYDNYCPNYATAMLPLPGRAVLMVASAYDGQRRCQAYGGRMMVP